MFKKNPYIGLVLVVTFSVIAGLMVIIYGAIRSQ